MEFTLARVEGARDLTLFFLRPKQELGEQQHNGCESCKQGKEQYGRQFSSAQSVPKGQRDEGNRDEAYGDGSHAPAELLTLRGKEGTAESIGRLHGNATHGSSRYTTDRRVPRTLHG